MSKHCSRFLVAFIAAAIGVTCVSADTAHAAGGSWGSSSGGFGSGGGLLGGRTPVRSLLGGLSSLGSRGSSGGFSGFGSGGSGGSGGSSGFSSTGSSGGGLLGLGIGPRLRGAFGAASRGSGSTGFGSTGGSTGGWGSTGGVGGSSGYSSSFAAPAVSYGSSGGSYVSSAPVAIGSYAVPSHDTGVVYGSIEDAYAGGLSSYAVPSMAAPATVYDSSIIDGQNILQSAPFAAPLSVETDYLAPVLDYGAAPTEAYGGSAISSDSILSDTEITPQSGQTFGPVDSPAGTSTFGEGLPEAPSPNGDEENDTTQLSSGKTKARFVGDRVDGAVRRLASSKLTKAKKNEAILSVQLSEDAVVYVNGKKTTTQGKLREYVSKRLKQNRSYRYKVKAVVERNGKKVIRSKMVRMTPGTNTFVKFDFDQPQVTTLVLKVPAGARVILDGHETKAVGRVRTFSTRKLTNEQAWNGYNVEVQFKRAGQTVIRKQQVNLLAGSTKVVDFGSEIANQLASK